MLCTLLLLCAGLIPSMADSGTWYYYKTTVTPSPSGGGKVYVSTSATNDPDYKQGSYPIEGREYSYGDNINAGTNAGSIKQLLLKMIQIIQKQKL